MSLFGAKLPGGWMRSSSSDPRALDVVDGRGRFAGHGPHYSRRTPGAKTFTGVGEEIVLLHESLAAVWAVVHQKTPVPRGSGASRGRSGIEAETRWIWRNNVFRRLPGCPVRASLLVATATLATYLYWREKYEHLPTVGLRTEIGIKQVRSKNPGACYRLAGYERDRDVRGKRYLWAPDEAGAERALRRLIARSARPLAPASAGG